MDNRASDENPEYGLRWTTTRGENTLDSLIDASELRDSRYVDQDKVAGLMRDCAWKGTGYEFLWLVNESTSSLRPEGKSTAVLGLEAFAVRYSLGKAIGGSRVGKIVLEIWIGLIR